MRFINMTVPTPDRAPLPPASTSRIIAARNDNLKEIQTVPAVEPPKTLKAEADQRGSFGRWRSTVGHGRADQRHLPKRAERRIKRHQGITLRRGGCATTRPEDLRVCSIATHNRQKCHWLRANTIGQVRKRRHFIYYSLDFHWLLIFLFTILFLDFPILFYRVLRYST